MSTEEILKAMEDSEGHNVEITDSDGDKISGYVDLFESRYDNEDDDVNAGEASICVDTDDGSYLLYESNIDQIKIADEDAT